MSSINITLNTFDDEGNIVDTTNQDIQLSQVSDIIDHATQVSILADRFTIDSDGTMEGVDELENALDELREALVAASIVGE